MYFLGIYILPLFIVLGFFILSFIIHKKNRTNGIILLFIAIYSLFFLVFYIGIFPIGFQGLFTSMFLFPLSSILIGVYYKGKDKKVSRFFYRFSIFIVVAYIIGIGTCISLI